MPRPSSPDRRARNAAPAAAGEREASVRRMLDAVHALDRQLRRASREAADQAGVHAAQFHALHLLAQGSAPSLTELAGRTHTDISSVSLVITRLVERGLVTRTRAAGDWRQTSLALTARGRAIVRRRRVLEPTRLLRAAASLGSPELHALATGLARLAAGLHNDRKPRTSGRHADRLRAHP